MVDGEVMQDRSIRLFQLNSDLKPNSLDDRWFRSRYLDNINPQCFEICIEIRRIGIQPTVGDCEKLEMAVNEYMHKVLSLCDLKINSENHSGYLLNPEIYHTYKFYLGR